MPAPKVPRKSYERSKGTKNKAASEGLKRAWRERREEMLAKVLPNLKKAQAVGRMGVPDGMKKADTIPLWERAREQARKFITIMEDAGELPKVVIPGSEEEMAKRALQEAYTLAVSPLSSAQNKTAAIRVVLEYTKAKPESKSKLTLDKSEEWLAALAADMKKDDGEGGQ